MSEQRDAGGSVRWWQCVYGKRVEEPGGPIRPAEEHGRTGASAGLHDAVAGKLRPSEIGIGGGQNFAWGSFPWNDRGGIVLVPVRVDGEDYVVAGRVRTRSERGEGQPGRRYFQCHYLVTPAGAFHPGVLSELDERLIADPLTEFDDSMDMVTTHGAALSDPLPKGWLDVVAPLLRAVMSGQPVTMAGEDEPIGDLMERLCRCLCAMPSVLAWRLPVGARMAQVDPDVAIGHGQSSALALVADADELLETEDADLALGDHYVRWLTDLVQGCRTLVDLRAAIDRDLEQFVSHDSIDPETTWQEVALLISRTVREEADLEALEAWLKSDGGRPPELAFEILRTEALARVLAFAGRGHGPGLQLLERVTGPAWSAAWRELSASEDTDPRALDLGALVGAIDPLEPNAALRCRTLPLPETLERTVADRLLRDLERQRVDAELDPAWLDLAQPADTDARWLRSWQDAADASMFWRRVHVARKAGNNQALTSSASVTLQTVIDLGAGVPVTPAALARLTRAAPAGEAACADRDHALAVVEHGVIPASPLESEPGRLTGVLLLAEALDAAGKSTRWTRLLDRPEKESGDELRGYAVRLAGELAEAEQVATSGMARLLLVAWPHLDKQERLLLGKLLGRRLGQPAAWMLWGTKEALDARSADLAGVAEAAMPSLLSGESTALARLARGLVGKVALPSGIHERQLAVLLVDWVITLKSHDSSLWPAFRTIGSLWGGTIPRRQRLAAGPWKLVLAVVQHHPIPPDVGPLLDLAPTHDDRLAMLRVLPPGGAATPSDAVLKSVVESAATDVGVASVWAEVLAGRGLGSQVGWRMIPALQGRWPGGEPLTTTETNVLKHLKGASLASLGAAGVPLGRDQLNKIKPADLTEGEFDEVQVARLVRGARDAKALLLAKVISEWAIEVWGERRGGRLTREEIEKLWGGRSFLSRAVRKAGGAVQAGSRVEPAAQAILKVSLNMLEDKTVQGLLKSYRDA